MKFLSYFYLARLTVRFIIRTHFATSRGALFLMEVACRSVAESRIVRVFFLALSDIAVASRCQRVCCGN